MEAQQSRKCQIEFYPNLPEVHDDRRHKKYHSSMRVWCWAQVSADALRFGRVAWPNTEMLAKLRSILEIDTSIAAVMLSNRSEREGISFVFDILIEASSPKAIVRDREQFLKRIQAEKVAEVMTRILSGWAAETEISYEAQQNAEQANHIINQFASRILKEAEQAVGYEERLKELRAQVIQEASLRAAKMCAEQAGKPMNYADGKSIPPHVAEVVFATLPQAVVSTNRWSPFAEPPAHVTTEKMKELKARGQ